MTVNLQVNPNPPFPLWHQLGGGSSIQTWALPLCSQQSFCEKTKGGEENKLGVTSWRFLFFWVVKSWGQSVDSWEANRKLSQAVPLLWKEERIEEFMLLLQSQIEVFRCSTWRALGKVSEMAGTVRTSATTDGGFHTATFSCIRWMNVTVPDTGDRHTVGRKENFPVSSNEHWDELSSHLQSSCLGGNLPEKCKCLCASDNPGQASGPLLLPEEPCGKVLSSAEIRNKSALETEQADPHTSVETTPKKLNGPADQFNKTSLAPTDL